MDTREPPDTPTRAAQKLNLSSPHRRKRHSSGEDEAHFRSDFSGALARSPPSVPPALLRRIGVREVSTVGKVKVMLRVASAAVASDACAASGASTVAASSSSFFNVDTRRKQVTLFDPATCGGASTAPEDRRVGVAAPKMFAFDAIFTADDSQSEVCSSALTDVIHAVINGSDGCLFCFGHARLGKSHTMLGNGDASGSLGVMPCAISWLFRGINEQKQKTGARFSVRVSAVEVAGQSQHLRDLLAGYANDCEQSPGVYLRDDPLLGAQLQHNSELRVPTAEKAAFYLDAAVAARTRASNTPGEEPRDSHLLFTLHVYQYSVDKSGKGGVAGGRSRLHLLDLGSCERGRTSGGIPLSGVANVLLAIFNGQKHLPYREHKLTQLLKECLGSLTCHVAMIAHVSPLAQNYTETLTTVQLAARIHRMRRRRIKFGCGAAGSGGSSGEDSRLPGTSSSDVDPSSSEQSADTVIYVGPSDDATDGEHPPVYIPSLNSGDNRCAMGKVLRGSSAERQPSSIRGSPAKAKLPSSSEGSPAKSAKSSKIPVRPSGTTPKSPQVTRQNKSKGTGGKSDEQWIDGPRISRSKVAEARSLLKESHKRETWVDGPQAGSGAAPNPSAAPAAAPTAVAAATATNPATPATAQGYGYMDNHKKCMIQRWVENQTVQIQQKLMKSGGGPPEYKEMTQFKTCEDSETSPEVEETPELPPPQQVPLETAEEPKEQARQPATAEAIEEEEDDEDCVSELPPPLPLLHQQHNKEKEASVNNYELKLKILEERRRTMGADADVGGVDDIEIIEVEEPLEPVPMQDCCLQVTEEDIALCMGEFYMPESDAEGEEHPLRVLSQENLTIVSTFTDSLSVTTDLDRGIPGSHSVLSEDLLVSATSTTDKIMFPRKMDHISKLHELYKNPGGLDSASKGPSRCQAITINDMLYGSTTSTTTSAAAPDSKMCLACRQVMSRGLWYPSLAVEGSHLCSQHLQENQSKSWYNSGVEPTVPEADQPLKLPKVLPNSSIASLRHPDGASNPNLDKQEEVRTRFPGNGAASDHEDELVEAQEERTVTGKSDDDESAVITSSLPSSTPAASGGNKTPRLTRLFAGARRSPGKSPQKSQGSKKQKTNRAPSSEGYDSGLDSVIIVTRTSKSPSHQATGVTGSSKRGASSTVHCESSGYESVQRDSECSSLASSHESNEGVEANPPPASQEQPPAGNGKKATASTNTGPTGWWRLFPSCARNKMRTPSVDW
ncbi:kinesin-like protein CG14535 isoform X2 [Neocloeon triangulifer]|uniref:kinesin-like protein CG14535 isoform X2 n=1 Tax=Neocloeon triangulifer TaxID=2078957 RepID=UPI00286ED639|nr:kinesin-like protein CG14535 isoform X2 [Neocloeon triangulifer]